jgi:hypothetical protein
MPDRSADQTEQRGNAVYIHKEKSLSGDVPYLLSPIKRKRYISSSLLVDACFPQVALELVKSALAYLFGSVLVVS